MANAGILVLNAGSSSLKFSVFTAGKRGSLDLLCRGQVAGLGGAPTFRASDAGGRITTERSWPQTSGFGHDDATDFLLSWLRAEGLRGGRLAAAGHRVVHGGVKFDSPVRINPAVLAELGALRPLAPLHQPHNLAAIAAVNRLAPDLPQVACFDTAFHRTQPPVAQAFAIPRVYTNAGIRRYGFHGLSYEYISHALRSIDPGAARGRTIVAHLGNGASMCALLDGRSIATTMGFTAIDGLVMGTRSGEIDPGVLLYLTRHAGLSIEQVERMLYENSGLLGVSGVSSDMRELLASDDPRAREAIDLFVYRAARELGSLAAALGGVDALVFTGGIGENAATIRAAICARSAWLGISIDQPANARPPDPLGTRISVPGRDDRGVGGAGRVAVWVIPTNEELMIARHTARLVATEQTTPTGELHV